MKAYKVIDKIVELSKKDVEFSENYRFNHHDILKRINLYINNRFLSRTDGIFWNIGNYRAQHFSKNTELDTKDLMPYAEGTTNMVQAWVLRKVLRQWLDEQKLALTLNDLAENCSYYGSSVWKIVDNDVELVNLQNLYFDPLAKSIRDTDIVEKHYLSSNDLRDKKEVWDNVDELLKKDPDEDGRYEINEFFGWYCEGKEYNEEEDGWKRIISYGKGDEEIILFEEDVTKEDNPYYDFHLTKYEGRWLRMGIIERLFSLQERMNELVNQNAQTTEIASLLLFKSANGDVTGNVLEGALNGQIINDDTLQQIGITNTGLNQFISEVQLIESQADKICLTPDVIQGEALPSGTPFRSLATITNAARSSFKMLRENIGERISYILKEIILPDVIKGFNKGKLIDIIEDDGDTEIFDKAVKARASLEALLQGNVITPQLEEEIELMVNEGIEKQGRKLEIPKGFFNFKWGIKFNITGEAYDKAQQNVAYEAALQYIMSNPQITGIPLFRQYLENNGIPYWKLTPEQIEQLQQGQGGQAPSVEPREDKLMSQVDSQ
jgi:hypothetical protein